MWEKWENFMRLPYSKRSRISLPLNPGYVGPIRQGGKSMKSASLLAVLTLATLAAGASAQVMDFAKVEIITEKLAPNVYMLSGSAGLDPSHEDAAGGRIGVLAGPDGVLMIDSQYAQLGE